MSTFFTWVAIGDAADEYCERASASYFKKKKKQGFFVVVFFFFFLEGAVREGTSCKGEIKGAVGSPLFGGRQ